MRKPQPEIFHRPMGLSVNLGLEQNLREAMKRLRVTAKTSFFVGDHPEVDIMGAKNAAMKAI